MLIRTSASDHLKDNVGYSDFRVFTGSVSTNQSLATIPEPIVEIWSYRHGISVCLSACLSHPPPPGLILLSLPDPQSAWHFPKSWMFISLLSLYYFNKIVLYWQDSQSVVRTLFPPPYREISPLSNADHCLTQSSFESSLFMRRKLWALMFWQSSCLQPPER